MDSNARQQPANDALLLRRIRPIAGHHPRWGQRLIWGRLRECGEGVGRKRVQRIWRRPGLQCTTRRISRKIHNGPRLNPTALQPNDVWCYDFVHDSLVNGQPFRRLLIKDEASAYALAIEVSRSFNAAQVQAVLLRLIRRYGAPRYLRSDNGPEFIATALKARLTERGLQTADGANRTRQTLAKRIQRKLQRNLPERGALYGTILHVNDESVNSFV